MPKCDITLSSDAVLVSIGVIHAIVDCQVVVEASLSGDYKVLDTETLLVLEDKSILGRVSLNRVLMLIMFIH